MSQARPMWFAKAFGDIFSADTLGHSNLYDIDFSTVLFN